MWVTPLCHHACFLQKTIRLGGVGAGLGIEDLHCHRPVQLDIHAMIHTRHAAATDQAVNFEAAKCAADRGIISHGALVSAMGIQWSSYGDLSDLVNKLIEALHVGIQKI